MAKRNRSKGRKKFHGFHRECEFCRKPRKWFTQEWTYKQHVRVVHQTE